MLRRKEGKVRLAAGLISLGGEEVTFTIQWQSLSRIAFALLEQWRSLSFRTRAVDAESNCGTRRVDMLNGELLHGSRSGVWTHKLFLQL